MSRKRRSALTILLIVVAILVLVVLTLPLLIPKDQVRVWIVQRAEQQLQRPVAVGAVRAGILPSPWVRLSGVELGEVSGKPPTRLSIESVELRLALGPLLRRRAEITSIVIEGPRVELVLADAHGSQAVGAGASGPGLPGAHSGDASAAADASLRRASDAQKPEHAPGSSNEGSARSPGGSTPSGGPVTSPVDINIRELLIRDGSLSVRYADGRSFLELAGIGERLSAQVSREAVVALEGETILESLELHLPAGVLGHGLTARLTKRLSFDTNDDRLTVAEASLKLGDLPATLTGEVTKVSTGQPEADLHLAGGPARVENILGYLPQAMLAVTEGVRSSGTLALTATVRGPLGPPPGEARLLDGKRPQTATRVLDGRHPQTADFAIDLALSDGRIEHPRLAVPLDQIAMRLRVTPDTLALRSFSVRSGENRLQAHATVTDYTCQPSLSAGLDADVDLALVGRLQSAEGTGRSPSDQGTRESGNREGQPEPLQLSGRAAARLSLAGRLDEPQRIRADGTVRLREVNVSGADLPLPLRGFSGDLTLRDRDLTIRELAGLVGASDVRASGEITNYRALDPSTWPAAEGSEPGQAGKPSGPDAMQRSAQSPGPAPAQMPTSVARVDLNVRSGHLDLDELLLQPRESAERRAPRGSHDASPAGATPPPPAAVLAVLEGTIVAEVDELIVNHTTARDVKGLVRLDRGRIQIDPASGLAFGGTLAGRGEIDFRDPMAPRFDMQMQAHKVQARELYGYAAGLGRFGQLGGFLSGEIDATANLRGALTDSLKLDLGSLSSDGLLQTRAASLAGHPLQNSLATYLALPQLERLQISDWLQPFRIANGRVTVDGMNLKAGDMEVTARGWQAIDGAVELGFDLWLPQRLSAAIRKEIPAELQPILFEGTGERILVPLSVTGRLPKPKIALDERRVREGAQRRAQERLATERERLEQEALRQAGEFLKGLTDRPGDTAGKADTSAAPDSAAAQPDARRQLEKELRERLKGLFKR